MRGRGRLVGLCLAAILCGGRAPAENIDPDGDGHRHAWGENVGWIDAEPSGDGGPGLAVADFSVTGWLWGENVGWVSASCQNTAVCATSPYGVANDGYGNLSGFAWSENAGWVRFDGGSCGPDPTCGVRIDPATGYFQGRAWSENLGWITFAEGPPISTTVRTSWCQAVGGPPGTGPRVTMSKAGQEILLHWTPQPGAAWLDVVGGRLSLLRSSGGDYTTATQGCMAGKVQGPAVSVPAGPGESLWFLGRAANCRGRGPYDEGAPSQVGSRDAEIAASGRGCP
jgi:hypothetical protein